MMADAGHNAFLGKKDLSNCFWSIRMPYKWCRAFRVNTPQGCFRWLTLPFRWKYSPVHCQRLVSALVMRALRDLRARGVTYLDDVLVSAVGRCCVRVAARLVSRVLGKAGFLISPKSVVEPVRTLDFIGKHFSAAAMTVVGSLVCMWNAMPVRPVLAFVAAFVCPANDSQFEPWYDRRGIDMSPEYTIRPSCQRQPEQKQCPLAQEGVHLATWRSENSIIRHAY